MALQLEDKKAIVKDVHEVASSAVSALAAHYRGLTVSEMTELRDRARENNVYVRIVKNTLARRALEDTEHACLKEELTGPMVLMLSRSEPGAAARVVRDFMKTHDALEVKAIALGGELHAADQLKKIASLPSKDEAIATLMSLMNAPVTQLARTMTETYSSLVRVTAAVGDSKSAA